MPDDEQVEVGEKDEAEEAVEISVDGEESDDAVQGEQEAEQQADDEKGESEEELQQQEKPQEEQGIDFAKELAEAEARLRQELSQPEAKEEKKVYTREELKAYKRQVEQKRVNGEISDAEYVAYVEQIDDLNEERLQAEWDQRSTRKIARTRAEENVTAWAQANAPDLLDARTKRGREAMDFGKRELGVVFEGGNMVVPETVGRVLLGLAHGTQSGDDVKQAEARGREQALREKEVRDRDLKTGDKPPKSEQGGKKKQADRLSAIEKDVQERLDLSPNAMKIYKRMRGHKDVEILQ